MGSKVRDIVFARDNHRCVYCRHPGSKSNPLTLHHIVFRCNGGKTTPENLMTLCSECHKQLHLINPGNRSRKGKKHHGSNNIHRNGRK